MPGHYHAIVWIDHREARVFHFNIADVDRLVLHPHNPTRHIHHKANSIGSGHAAEDQDFLQRVADAIADAGAVLVTGPANAKTELVKHIERHAPALGAKIAGVETIRPTASSWRTHASTSRMIIRWSRAFSNLAGAPLRSGPDHGRRQNAWRPCVFRTAFPGTDLAGTRCLTHERR